MSNNRDIQELPLLERLKPPYNEPEKARDLFRELLSDRGIHPVISLGNGEPAYYRLFRAASLWQIREGKLDDLINVVGWNNILLFDVTQKGNCGVYVRDYFIGQGVTNAP
ncbi:hypothetical protein J4207_02485 [Candidatus Woesearchaeota archaeon]|nr:hypothetical protein [Candidatus Woesearchaeota archaeon]